jgi:hypothetical protein
MPTASLVIRDQEVRLPDFLPEKGWQIDTTRKGYLRWTSRGTGAGIKRGARAHRVVVERLAGRPLTEEVHVHHMDFDKLNNCPCNLILMPASLNPSSARRDPYTGEFMSAAAYQRRYGL